MGNSVYWRAVRTGAGVHNHIQSIRPARKRVVGESGGLSGSHVIIYLDASPRGYNPGEAHCRARVVDCAVLEGKIRTRVRLAIVKNGGATRVIDIDREPVLAVDDPAIICLHSRRSRVIIGDGGAGDVHNDVAGHQRLRAIDDLVIGDRQGTVRRAVGDGRAAHGPVDFGAVNGGIAAGNIDHTGGGAGG